jgi:hypothetical protein
MGKQARKEREEERESFATKRSKEKRKHTLIAIGIMAGVAAIVGVSAYNFANLSATAPGAPPGAGVLGDEHVHSSMLVKIFGDTFDFSQPAYQVKSSWIHFEAQDGTTVHRHSTGVTLGYLFETLGITLTDACYNFPDGREFCTNDDYSLKFYVNHMPVSSLTDYVFKDQDRILISYGNENQTQIDTQLAQLDAQPILS